MVVRFVDVRSLRAVYIGPGRVSLRKLVLGRRSQVISGALLPCKGHHVFVHSESCLVSCVCPWWSSPSFRLDFFDKHHFAATLWASHEVNLSRRVVTRPGLLILRFVQPEEFFDRPEQSSFSWVQESVVSYLDESVWQDVLQEASDELFGLESHLT